MKKNVARLFTSIIIIVSVMSCAEVPIGTVGTYKIGQVQKYMPSAKDLNEIYLIKSKEAEKITGKPCPIYKIFTDYEIYYQHDIDESEAAIQSCYIK